VCVREKRRKTKFGGSDWTPRKAPIRGLKTKGGQIGWGGPIPSKQGVGHGPWGNPWIREFQGTERPKGPEFLRRKFGVVGSPSKGIKGLQIGKIRETQKVLWKPLGDWVTKGRGGELGLNTKWVTGAWKNREARCWINKGSKI